MKLIHDIPDFDGSDGLLAIVCNVGEYVNSSIVENTELNVTKFITDPQHELQVAVISRSANSVIPAHRHLPIDRHVKQTTEVLFFLSGKTKVRIFNSKNQNVETLTLIKHDILILLNCGHSLEFEKDSTLIEVKQGPYAGSRELDKEELFKDKR